MSNGSSSNKLPAGSALRRSHSSRSLVVVSDDSSHAEILTNFKIRPRTPSIETRKNRLGQLKLSIKEGIHGMKLPLLTGLVRRPPSRSRRRLSSAAGCQQSSSVHNDESNANNTRKHSKLPLHSTDVDSERPSCSLTATPNLRARRHDSTGHLDGRVAEDRLSFPGSHAHQNDLLTTAEDGGAVAFDTVDEHDAAAAAAMDPVEQAENRVDLDAANLAAADSAPFARLGDDIDVSLLTKYLYPESETVETAEPWSLDFLCGVVSAQFLPDYSATTTTLTQ
ncbi:hypothetical protein D917_05711 [Trichinella nativa]|uniref:Uncharacterized protein n=1 Tax=Trichinella nativa TaxID=6335 RepID=A0A1Y3EVW9_9BILA|nr:hypothetical protein D917_05711 [Trichinella nativa]